MRSFIERQLNECAENYFSVKLDGTVVCRFTNLRNGFVFIGIIVYWLECSQICHINYPKLFGFKHASISYNWLIFDNIHQQFVSMFSTLEFLNSTDAHILYFRFMHVFTHFHSVNSTPELNFIEQYACICVVCAIQAKKDGIVRVLSRVRSSNCIQSHPTAFMHCFFSKSMRLPKIKTKATFAQCSRAGVWETNARNLRLKAHRGNTLKLVVSALVDAILPLSALTSGGGSATVAAAASCHCRCCWM